MTSPDVLIDARMLKRLRPEVQRGLAPLTIGPGPNSTADSVVEASWEQLGQVLAPGPSLPLLGEPRAIAGHARDRYVYAPLAGAFRIKRRGRPPGQVPERTSAPERRW